MDASLADHCYDVCLNVLLLLCCVVVECLVWGVAEQLVCVCIAQSTCMFSGTNRGIYAHAFDT